MVKINPFKPNSPVSTGMFAGRLTEIITLEKGLHQTKNNNPINFLITGERGIGKSSLLTYIKFLANGEIKSPDYNLFNFLTIRATCKFNQAAKPISSKLNFLTF